MNDQIETRTGPPPDRLERWLVRKIRAGALIGLPQFVPLRGAMGQDADAYARRLLAQLQKTHDDEELRENLKDDGRAFRSWAERAHHTLNVAV